MGGAEPYLRNISRELQSLAPDGEFIGVVPQAQVYTVCGLARTFV